MNQVVKDVLHTIASAGYEAYLVGGYPRDYLLNISTNDYDVTTSATPEELKKIFPDADYTHDIYGRVTVKVNDIEIEITTFRVENGYEANRFPKEIKYVRELPVDLKRRDFIINTLCMDENEEMIDLLGARNDIDNQTIRSVGNPFIKMQEDSLRILRAVRFAAMLNFKIDSELKEAMFLNKAYLKKLSYNRKREELDRIFTSKYAEYGVSLLNELGVEEELEISGLKEVNINVPLLAVWAQLQFSSKYQFPKSEQLIIETIRKLLRMDLNDSHTLYNYGVYYCGIAATLLNIPKNVILDKYKQLPIHHRSEIALSSKELLELVEKDKIGDVYNDVEYQILEGNLENSKIFIKKYIMEKYHGRKR